MKVLEFRYNNKDKSTKRTLAVLSEPKVETMYFGIDISEVSDEGSVDLLKDLADAKAQYDSVVALIMSKYDVTHNFRRFDPAKMEDVLVEAY